MPEPKIEFGVFDYTAQPFSEDTYEHEQPYVGYVFELESGSRHGPYTSKEVMEQEVSNIVMREWANATFYPLRSSHGDIDKVLQALVGKPITSINHDDSYFYLWVGQRIELYFERGNSLYRSNRPQSWSGGTDGKVVTQVEGTVLTFEDGSTHDLVDVYWLSSIYT